MKKYNRIALGLLLIFSIAYFVRQFAIPSCGELQTSISTLGWLSPLIFIFSYIVATVLFIPGTLLTLMSGILFGPYFGTALVSLSSTIGASLAFLIAKYFAHDFIKKMIEGKSWFEKFRSSVEENGFNFVILVRLVPLFPFNGLNYACGLVPLRFKDYFLGSLIGMFPATFAYVYVGNAAGCAILDGKFGLPDEVKIKLFTAIVLLSVLSLLPIILKKFKKRNIKICNRSRKCG